MRRNRVIAVFAAITAITAITVTTLLLSGCGNTAETSPSGSQEAGVEAQEYKLSEDSNSGTDFGINESTDSDNSDNAFDNKEPDNATDNKESDNATADRKSDKATDSDESDTAANEETSEALVKKYADENSALAYLQDYFCEAQYLVVEPKGITSYLSLGGYTSIKSIKYDDIVRFDVEYVDNLGFVEITDKAGSSLSFTFDLKTAEEVKRIIDELR